MLGILPQCADWVAGGRPFAVATVVRASGSVPRPPGTSLAVGGDGEVRGSLSGGCVDGEVAVACAEVLETGIPRLLRYGYSDADAFAIGLTCGGEIEVQVQAVLPDTRGAHDAGIAACAGAARGTGVVLVWSLDDPGRRAVLGAPADAPPDSPDWAAALEALTAQAAPGGAPRTGPGDAFRLAAAVGAAAATGRSGIVEVPRGDCGTAGYFVATRAAPPRLLVFGANDFAAAVVRQGALLGYRTTLCDPRPVFATERRFPDADEVVAEWPDRYLRGERDAGRLDGRTVVCLLAHDARFDVPLLELALQLPVGYVGAMGSRRAHAEREAALRRRGVPAAALARLRSPIGLDLGGSTPAEFALSVLAEVVAASRGRSAALPLSRTGGPLHGGPAGRSPDPPRRARPRPAPGPLPGPAEPAPGLLPAAGSPRSG